MGIRFSFSHALNVDRYQLGEDLLTRKPRKERQVQQQLGKIIEEGIGQDAGAK
jgi:hypothetical protein